MTDSMYHTAVLLPECIEALEINPSGIYVDATFGGGSHSQLILDQLGSEGRLIAFDRDADAQQSILEDPRFTLVHNDFKYLTNFLRYLNVIPVDGILADLGISSHQVDTPERGFSFRFDAPLDMRMDQEGSLTAAQLINQSTEKELQEIFSKYGEVQNAKTLAQAVVRKRNFRPLSLTSELIEAAEEVAPRNENIRKYLAPVFQALRIAVNGEMDGLEKFIEQAAHVLKPGGRMAVLTYHSLEDRIIKNYFQDGNVQGVPVADIYGNKQTPFAVVNKKPILPSESEIQNNPRARSAKLRIAKKI